MLLCILLGLGHGVLSFVLAIYVFGAGMARFDVGGAPDLGEWVAAAIATVLLFPLVSGFGDALPQPFRGGGFPWQHSVLVANSLIWASVLTWGVVRVRRRLQAQARS